MSHNSVKIVVATHKKYQMPADTLYLPVQVGKELTDQNFGYQTDDTGTNISDKNSTFNELTALYWMRHNIDFDYLGLCHYRRYLGKKGGKSLTNVLTTSEITQMVASNTILLPKERNYVIESNYSHYVHAHESEPLELTREVIKHSYPGYLANFDTVMHRTHAHMFNMFVMPKELLAEYTDWLFAILFEVEKQLDTSSYSAYEKRVYGFLSELLLDVWLSQHNHLKLVELPVINLESQHWAKKIFKFLLRKIGFSNSSHIGG